MTTQPDDHQLMTRVATGDQTAFALLMDRHLLRVRTLAARILQSDADAEDAAQEVFIKLWRHAPKWRGDHASGASLSTWLYRVALNEALGRRRRRRFMAPIEKIFNLASPGPGPEESLLEGEARGQVAAAVAALPGRWQEAILLTYSAGLANAEAAAVMQVSLKAFEALLVRARKRLRQGLVEGTDPSSHKGTGGVEHAG